MYKFLAGMIVMAAIGAFVTKPSKEAVYEELASQLRSTLSQQQLHEAQGVEAAALLACRLSPTSCVDLLISGLDVVYEDRYVYAKVDVDGFGMRAACYGVFDRFFCPDGLIKK